MDIFYATSEFSPLAREGDLGEIVYNIVKGIKEKNNVKVFLPFYSFIDKEKYDINLLLENISIEFYDKGKFVDKKYNVLFTKYENIDLYFISSEDYLNRDKIYEGLSSNSIIPIRYIFFTKSVLNFCVTMNFIPDIFHCLEWHTALIPAYIESIYKDKFYKTKTIFSFSNNRYYYQGMCNEEITKYLDLNEDILKVAKHSNSLWKDHINFMKLGLYYSHFVSTNSDTYANELLLFETGYGLERDFYKIKNKLAGIINGIDYQIWSPEKDDLNGRNYYTYNLDGKEKCKKDLLKVFGLKYKKNVPVFGLFPKLNDDMGLDILIPIINNILAFQDIQIIIAGNGELYIEEYIKKLRLKYPNKVGKLLKNVDEKLIYKLYSGLDFILIPSYREYNLEACAVALKYGTIPIVRAAGVLNDIIVDYTKHKNGNGIKFYNYNGEKLYNAIIYAIYLFDDKRQMYNLIKNAMNYNYSWDRTVKRISELYNKVINSHKVIIENNQTENIYSNYYYTVQEYGSLKSAEIIVPMIINEFNPKSVIDVGCGIGSWLSVFNKNGVTDYIGIDTEFINSESLKIPKDRFMKFDICKPVNINRKFDLAISLEVAEHIPEEFIDIYIDSLTNLSDLILFSGAIPLQGDIKMGHINEKWISLWIKLFSDKNYEAFDFLRDKIWDNINIEPWYIQNILLFVKRDNKEFIKLSEKYKKDKILNLIHPRFYLINNFWKEIKSSNYDTEAVKSKYKKLFDKNDIILNEIDNMIY